MPTPDDAADLRSALDPRLAAMLGMLGGGGGGVGSDGADPMDTLRAQIDGLASQHPQLAPLMQMFMQQHSGGPEAATETAPGEPVDRDAASVDPADLERLLHHAGDLEAELEGLRQRNDALAAALGACHLCFGDQDGCEVCHGLGTPGWRRPAPNAFRRFVGPALRRVQAEERSSPVERARRRSPFEPPGGAEGVHSQAAGPGSAVDPQSFPPPSTQRKAGCHHV